MVSSYFLPKNLLLNSIYLVKGSIKKNWKPEICSTCTECSDCFPLDTFYPFPNTSINGTSTRINEQENEQVLRIYVVLNRAIRFLPISTHKIFPKLLRYVFKRCEIEIITRKNFKGLYNLEKIKLSGNKIEAIESRSFNDQIELKELDLSSNKLKYLNEDLLMNQKKLKIIDLSENQLITTSHKLFINKKNLKKIDLRLNTIAEFIKTIELRDVTIFIHPQKKIPN